VLTRQVCVNPTQVCVNPTQVCVNPTQVCVNPPQAQAQRPKRHASKRGSACLDAAEAAVAAEVRAVDYSTGQSAAVSLGVLSGLPGCIRRRRRRSSRRRWTRTSPWRRRSLCGTGRRRRRRAWRRRRTCWGRCWPQVRFGFGGVSLSVFCSAPHCVSHRLSVAPLTGGVAMASLLSVLFSVPHCIPHRALPPLTHPPCLTTGTLASLLSVLFSVPHCISHRALPPLTHPRVYLTTQAHTTRAPRRGESRWRRT
jgi:hypothetical protein